MCSTRNHVSRLDGCHRFILILAGPWGYDGPDARGLP